MSDLPDPMKQELAMMTVAGIAGIIVCILLLSIVL